MVGRMAGRGLALLLPSLMACASAGSLPADRNNDAAPLSETGTVGFVDLDLGVTDSTDDLGIDLAAAHADGLTRTTFYVAWRDLEPSDGKFQLGDLDAVTERARATSTKLTVTIEVTDTDCVEWGMTDAECVAPKFPSDLPFSRSGEAFEAPAIARRLSALVNAIVAKYDPAVLTHLYVGNEVDRYVRVVQHDSGKDLAPGFVKVLSQIRANVKATKHPKLGTVTEWQPWSEYTHLPTLACPAVEVLGFTMYPTEEDAEGDDLPPAKIVRWMAAARAAVSPCAIALNEVGASALPPFGTPEEQQAVAAAVVRWTRANPKVFDYVTWFSMFDNEDMEDTVFEGMGLMTREKVKRPAYTTWLSAAKVEP